MATGDFVPEIYIPDSSNADYDFIGFNLDNVAYGYGNNKTFIRVSDGSRFNENLLPTTQDKTVQIPGRDGTYYFGTYYTQRDIQLSIAFDNMTETVLNALRRTMNKREFMELYFYEAPYKVYTVMPKSGSTIKYMCFNSLDNNLANSSRVYKGEATLSFTCYDVFARTPHSRKYIHNDNFNYDEKFKTYTQWKDVIGLKTSAADFALDSGRYDTYVSGKGIHVYNPGNLDTDFKLFLNRRSSSSPDDQVLNYRIQSSRGTLSIENINYAENDDGICINTKTKLIQGFSINNGTTNITSNLYNKFITSGDFFKIPKEVGKLLEYYISVDLKSDDVWTEIPGYCFNKIRYDYLWY